MPRSDANEADGVVTRFDEQNRYAPIGQRQFQMPASAYRSLAAKLDQLIDRPGEATWCVDGTAIAFERVRAQHVTSGAGGCERHFEQIGQLIWNYLRQFAPDDDLPIGGDWEPATDESLVSAMGRASV
jgi:hypothetical protein